LIYSLENFFIFFSSMKLWFQPIERSVSMTLRHPAFARFWKIVNTNCQIFIIGFNR
jgi:hypothetical protein